MRTPRKIGSSIGFGWEDQGCLEVWLLYSPFSILSIFSVLTFFSFGCLLSVASIGSIASVGSIWSVASVGCVNGFFEVCGPLKPKEDPFDRHLEKDLDPETYNLYARVVYPVSAGVLLLLLWVDYRYFGKRLYSNQRNPRALMADMLP